MPFLILKRDDIPAGTLQVLDLKPNESQRNLIYETPGQSKYIKPAERGTAETETDAGVVTVTEEVRGLAAYLLTNTCDGVITQATGTVTVASALAGDTVTIGAVLFTAAAVQESGSNNFDVSLVAATGTVVAAGVQSGDTVTIDGITLTAAGETSEGSAEFDEGDPATGTVTAAGVEPGDTVTIAGVTLTASGIQESGGLDFDEGDQATGTVTAAAVLPGDTVTISGITLTASGSQTGGGLDFDEGDPATGTITVAGPMAGGETITINGNVLSNAGAARTSGNDDFDGTLGTDILIASDIVAAINDAANSFDTDVTADNVGGTSAVVTLTAVVPGTVGNAITLASNDGVRLAVSGATLSGGVGTDTTVAASIAAAVNDGGGNGIVGTATASSALGVVTLTAVTPGAVGNAITLASSNGVRLAVSGATFAGGVGTDTTVAASIVAAVGDAGNGLTTTVTAGNVAGLVTLTAVTPGTVGNALTLASSNGVRLAVSGATLLGGVGTNDTVAASITTAINDVTNGIAATVTAAANESTVDLTAVTPGSAGNTITLASSDGTRLAVSGATLSGGSGSDIEAATSLVAALNDGPNGLGAIATASNTGGTSAVVDVTAVPIGVLGNAVTLASSGATLAVSGATLTGGDNADAFTPAVADTLADAVQALYAFGDLDTSAGALTLAAVNAAIAPAVLTTAQHLELLDILAGRTYVVPAGTQIEAASSFDVQPPVGAAGGPGFPATTLRDVFTTDSFLLSATSGHLGIMTRSDFQVFGVTGAAGEAIVIYNDDGTLF
jgi:hypothetical protein